MPSKLEEAFKKGLFIKRALKARKYAHAGLLEDGQIVFFEQAGRDPNSTILVECPYYWDLKSSLMDDLTLR